MKRIAALAPLALALLAARPASAGEQTLTLDGDVPTDATPEHFLVPFEVPEGTVEIQIDHDDLSEDNILDWGLYGPDRAFRGWGGGNSEPAVVGETAASRSYVPGPIEVGTWNVIVGKAKIKKTPASYHIVVHLRDEATLAPQPERQPYAPSPALRKGPAWFAGDFHVHSRESGDAQPSLDAIADFARARGLDFVEISDHNVLTQLDYFVDAQSRHPDLLFLPGYEFTTYHGHANAIGALAWVDHKIGFEGVTIEDSFAALDEQGAIVSINHPMLDLGDLCIGCAWNYELPKGSVGGVEIENGGWSESGQLFTMKALNFWSQRAAEGHHLAALGGSDDHRASTDQPAFGSPIGDPATMVYAEDLSARSILEGIRNGRTVVKLQDVNSPMVELSSSIPPDGDTVSAKRTRLVAKVTAGAGDTLQFVHNGQRLDEIDVTSDPFTAEMDAVAPATGEDFWRVEIHTDGHPITVTSHLWLRTGTASDTSGLDVEAVGGGCGCSVPAGGDSNAPLALALLGLGVAVRRRRARG
jgi:MYXO-CTERM domain-containing protein